MEDFSSSTESPKSHHKALVLCSFLGLALSLSIPSSQARMPESFVVKKTLSRSSVAVPRVPSVAPPMAKKTETPAGGVIAERRKERMKREGVTEPLHAAAAINDNHVGVYLTTTSVKNDEFLLETINALKAAGGTSLVIDVKGGAAYFETEAKIANELKLVHVQYDLDHVLSIAKEHGLYTIARYIAMKDDGLHDAAPETHVTHPKSNADLAEGWTDPGDPMTIAYNKELICDLSRKGFDEINLDYIRFSTASFGALKVFSATEKADRLEKFIAAASEAAHTCGNAKLGLSTFAILGWDYPRNVETLGQDVVRFAPLVDIISPMAYPATFTSAGYYNPAKNTGSRNYWLVYRTLTGYHELLGTDFVKVRPWIQGYGVDAKDMRDEINAVTNAGACGFQVWNASNRYAPTFKALLEWKRPLECDGEY